MYRGIHIYKIYPFTDILKFAADKSKEKEGTVLLEIQADILFTLSVLCEHDVHRKVCIFLSCTVQKMSKHSTFSFKGHSFFVLIEKQMSILDRF